MFSKENNSYKEPVKVKIIEDKPDNLKALIKMVEILGLKADPVLVTNKTLLTEVPPPKSGLVLLDQNLPGHWQGDDWLEYYKNHLNKVAVGSISNATPPVSLRHFPDKHGLILGKTKAQTDFKQFLQELLVDWRKK
ncbi:MAG: hypothetical protein ACOCU8_00160 [Patescibacteria group bacterium]